MLPWSDCEAFFEPDGSLRDVYVIGGGIPAWEGLLRIARTRDAGLEVDGEERPLPALATEALALRQARSPLLSIDWDGIGLNAHFFAAEDVELDLDPRAICSDERFEALIGFMATLAGETGKTVILTPENDQGRPYLAVSPTGEAVVVAPPSTRGAGEGSDLQLVSASTESASPPRMPACACDDVPPVHYLDEAPEGWVGGLPLVASAPWLTLRRCQTCRAYWAVDGWDKYAERVIVRVPSEDDWVERAQAIELRKALLLRSRGGAGEEACAWAGCGGRVVVGTVLCVDHLWEGGVRR